MTFKETEAANAAMKRHAQEITLDNYEEIASVCLKEVMRETKGAYNPVRLREYLVRCIKYENDAILNSTVHRPAHKQIVGTIEEVYKWPNGEQRGSFNGFTLWSVWDGKGDSAQILVKNADRELQKVEAV